jgi:hypothetical protein
VLGVPSTRNRPKTGDEALSINPEDREDEARPDAPTRELTAVPAAGSGDRCSNCGAPLAHDQRYCVQCGERRGQSTVPQPQPATEARSSRVRTAQARRAPRMSSGATLVAGVGVLLLAIGLGVLIGHYGKNTATPKASATPPVTILQPGGTGTGTSAAATNTASTPTSAPRHVNSASLTKKAQAKLKATTASKAVQQKATQAATKVLGGSNNLPPPTATTGSKCSNGQAGCQNGKFTGNFFGGG